MPKVMLVEDDATMRSLLQTLLELEGFEVVVSKNCSSQAILETCRQEIPDVLLLDVHLNQANGMDIVRALRQEQSPVSSRIIMMSGMELRDACLQAGADDFILKPYLPDDLVSLIRSQLSV